MSERFYVKDNGKVFFVVDNNGDMSYPVKFNNCIDADKHSIFLNSMDDLIVDSIFNYGTCLKSIEFICEDIIVQASDVGVVESALKIKELIKNMK